MELEYWWGPKFDDSLETIGAGVTRHEATETERIMHGISGTEFRWYCQDNKRTFEIEELRVVPTLGVGPDEYGCRFAHSMLDDSGIPAHLDGAVRLYSEAEMVVRLDADLKRAGRHTRYVKLWRVDGAIDVGLWKELLTHYFRDNSLVGEYFGASDPAMGASRQATCVSANADPYGECVPCELPSGRGPRLAIFHRTKEPEDAACAGRHARATERIVCGDRTISYMEADALELSKALTRMGEELALPSTVDALIFEDLNTTLPLVSHLGDKSVGLANRTVEAIGVLLETWRTTGTDRALAFTLEVEYEDRITALSVLGNVADLCEWFRTEPLRFPDEASGLTQWSEALRDYASQTYPDANDVPKMLEILQVDGMLCFPRRFLQPDSYELRRDDVGMRIRAVLPDSRLAGSVRDGRLQIALCFRLKSSRCSGCGGDYRLCPCSKFLDSGVTQEVEDVEVLGAFWTNRKA